MAVGSMFAVPKGVLGDHSRYVRDELGKWLDRWLPIGFHP